MAAIDKIYLSKKDAIEFYKYLEKIDKEFKVYFKNAHSILDYTYLYDMDSIEEDAIIPVSNFSEIVDRWLANRKDLPKIIRDELEYQYGSDIFKITHIEIKMI